MNSKKPFYFRLIKRVMDISVGLVMSILVTPIILIFAVAIRFDSPGNPFFLQRRIGYNGKLFTIIKLRGMYVDARQRFPDLYDYTKHDGLGFQFHYKDDPRVTSIGKIIRRTSIDELPNFYNVVFGTMSLVGPRPEVPDVFALYGQYKDMYVSVKPGITCTSKVTGRDELSKQETIELDLEYIRTQSISLDIQLLWKTFTSVIIRKDVY